MLAYVNMLTCMQVCKLAYMYASALICKIEYMLMSLLPPMGGGVHCGARLKIEDLG